jgi:hypothetical protein
VVNTGGVRYSERWLDGSRSRGGWIALVGIVCACGVGSGAASSVGAGAVSGAGGGGPKPISAVRQPLTTNHRSVVAHDTETMALVGHDGRLFAATDQWEYPRPSAAGQVLVKNSSTAPWTLFEQTQSLRVQALDSFAIPSDQGLGSGHALLITQAIVDGRSRLQWLLDRAPSFTSARSFALASTVADVRAFGAHEAGGVWAVYAGVAPTGVLRGVWSPSKRTLVFGARPELTVASSGSLGSGAQKVTAFADCAGALYVSIKTKLYRRNDGALPPGRARWILVYEAPHVGPHNSGLRGLTCVRHHGAPSLLMSTEGSGNVYRIDHLPRGQLASSVTPAGSHMAGGLVVNLEFSPIPAIRRFLADRGTTVPVSGPSAVHYVIAAYNNFVTIKLGAVSRQLFGLEWGYAGPCPRGRACQPGKQFDAAACLAVRTDRGGSPSYQLRCLGGPTLTPSGKITTPVRSGQAFVSVRTIAPSPFRDDGIYYGGYDCNFYPADGTAWIATSTREALASTVR